MTKIHAVVVDIEGTTTPISFVHEVLFPYARERLASFVAEHKHDPEVARALKEARTLGGQPEASDGETISLLIKWIDEDKKAGPLKLLQGMIWAGGYAAGVLKGPVYTDVPDRLNEWRGQGKALYVYSSGSVEAQKLIFGHSDQGDLTGLFNGFFDTSVGPKLEPASYTAIAEAAGCAPGKMLFLTDHAGEAAAAHTAGFKTIRLDREAPPEMWRDEDPTPVAGSFAAIPKNLNEIF